MNRILIFSFALFFSSNSVAANNLSCPKDLSNVELLNCMVNNLQQLESALAAAYEAALANAREDDSLYEHSVIQEHTLKSISTFKAYKEAECERQRALLTTGSMAGHAKVGCEMRLINARLDELKKY